MAADAGLERPDEDLDADVHHDGHPDATVTEEPAPDPVTATEDAALKHLYHSNKNRTFVRAIQGDYGLNKELERLRSMPRVQKASEIKFVDGPQAYSRHYVEPKDGITQTFHLHLEEYGPGGKSQKHGHVNEAAFYILDGVGYEIHDGIRYDWEAGDVAIVHNNCVHQHFNGDPERPARALVIKTKPMYLFMNMLFQKQVEPRQTEPAPGGEGFVVREEEEDFNHPAEGY
jgi:gentisate 1,2-dioxygenase